MLLEHRKISRYRLLLHGHDVTLAHVPTGERFAFVVRNPVSRFVSAFNDRFFSDHPRYNYPLREEERRAFAIFRTPDQLATALSSEDEAERRSAVRAMRGIAHLSTGYSYWFGDEAAFRARLPDLFFVGLQERLDDDFELLKQKLGLPPEARLPSDPIAAHRAFHPAGPLRDIARANLERWYEADLAFVELCREVAPVVNRATADQRGRYPSTRAPRVRLRAQTVAAGLFLLMLLIVTPEALGDRPYDPVGSGSILERIVDNEARLLSAAVPR